METIIQAIDKAMTKGVFNLDEASVILKSIEEVAGKLSDMERMQAESESLVKAE